ncbi:hypothetical protein L6R53_12950 [Myxococcota bacterium]|nr:hypothetical protein [Myxococcota bacterium]
MSPVLLSALALGCWTRAPGPAPLAVAEGPVATFEERVPANAIDLVLAVRAGSAHDPSGQEGLAWLTAHALVQAGGAPLEAALHRLGTTLSVEVGPELVVFGLRCRVDDAVACAELLGATVAAPAWDTQGPDAGGADLSAALERVRARARSRLAEEALGPGAALADRIFDRWTFEGHPYGRLPGGRSGALDAIGPPDLVRFHQEHYLRPATALGVAGEPSAEAVVDIQAALGGLAPRLYVDATPRVLPVVQGRRLLVASAPVSQDRAVLGHATELAPDHPDRLAVEAGLGILAQGTDSRLGRILGPEGGEGALVSAGLDPAWMRVQPAARVALPLGAQGDLSRVAVALAELRRLVTEGPSAQELDDWRAVAVGRIQAEVAAPQDRARDAAFRHLLAAPDASARLAAVRALDPAAVQAALARHLDPDHLRIVVLTAAPARYEGLGVEGSGPPAVPPADGAPWASVAPADYGIGVAAVLRASSEEILR